MKKLTTILAVLLVLAIAGIGFLYIDCAVTITAMGVTAAPAASQQETFDALARQVSLGAVIGTPFTTQDSLDSSDHYQLLTYSIRLRNTCFLPADQVEVQITPMQGDVLQVGDAVPRTLPARATGDIQATLLTGIDMHSTREITVTCYMWGFPFSIRTTFSR